MWGMKMYYYDEGIKKWQTWPGIESKSRSQRAIPYIIGRLIREVNFHLSVHIVYWVLYRNIANKRLNIQTIYIYSCFPGKHIYFVQLVPVKAFPTIMQTCIIVDPSLGQIWGNIANPFFWVLKTLILLYIANVEP